MTAQGGRGRREFVGTVLGGALAIEGVRGLGTAAEAEELPAAVRQMVHEWEAEAEQDKPSFDMSWTERVTGQYRQVFDAPEVAEGTVFHQTRTFMRGYADIYNAKDSEFSAVMVIRHAGIPMVANDRLWDELELGKESKLKDPETGKKARRNPFLSSSNPKDAKYGMIWPDGGIDSLIGRGVIALACNMALFRLVSMIAKKDGIEMKPAREKALANLVPGVIVQPSGIFAVARAQQAGCHYIRAT